MLLSRLKKKKRSFRGIDCAKPVSFCWTWVVVSRVFLAFQAWDRRYKPANLKLEGYRSLKYTEIYWKKQKTCCLLLCLRGQSLFFHFQHSRSFSQSSTRQFAGLKLCDSEVFRNWKDEWEWGDGSSTKSFFPTILSTHKASELVSSDEF